jgi:hypothetical protein
MKRDTLPDSMRRPDQYSENDERAPLPDAPDVVEDLLDVAVQRVAGDQREQQAAAAQRADADLARELADPIGDVGHLREDVLRHELRQARLGVQRAEGAQQAERDRRDGHQRQRCLERQRRGLLRALVARPLAQDAARQAIHEDRHARAPRDLRRSTRRVRVAFEEDTKLSQRLPHAVSSESSASSVSRPRP